MMNLVKRSGRHMDPRRCGRLRPGALALAALGLAVVFSLGAPPAPALATVPAVANVVAVQRMGTQLVDVSYDVLDTDGHAITVGLSVSPDGDGSFPVPGVTVSGDAGAGILSGTGRQIVWDAGADYPGHVGDTYVVKVTADDGQGVDGMVWIPAGNVRLGQAGIAEPVSDVYVEGFYIDTFEVSNAKYKAFIDAGGYTTEAYWNPAGWAWRVASNITLPANWDSNTYHGGGIAGNEEFPVNGVSWFEADAYCRWAGGRLPTEVEWEKAAKGGCETHGDPGQCDASDNPTYPWGEGISGLQANYWGSGDPYENNGWTTPVGYYDGSNHGGYQTINSSSPYGLYDVAGNVWEWCSTEYAGYPYDPNDGRENPPEFYSECCRVLRGGSYGYVGYYLRSAFRNYDYALPDFRYGCFFGFRCVRSGSAGMGWDVSAPFHLDTSTGACCTSAGTCTFTFQTGCATPSIWQGETTTCSPSPCLPSSAHGRANDLTLSVQAAPSPSTGDVRIVYQVPRPTTVSLRIFDASGRLVRQLVNDLRVAGEYSIAWDGRDDAGQGLPSGVYWTRMETAEGKATGTVILAR
jgi:formylglycine-generating enzyme required for sulfatase activity